MLLALFLVLFGVAGFIAACFTVLALPFVVWGCFFAGVAASLCGNGFGEAWELAVGLTLGASVCGTAAGVGSGARSMAAGAVERCGGKAPFLAYKAVPGSDAPTFLIQPGRLQGSRGHPSHARTSQSRVDPA